MIYYRCTHCDRKLRADGDRVGHFNTCPFCQQKSMVPPESTRQSSEERAAERLVAAGAHREVTVPLHKHKPNPREQDPEMSLKEALFGFWKKHEEKRLADNHRWGMKMKYMTADIPEDEDMRFENNSQKTIHSHSGTPPWMTVGLVGAALAAPYAYEKLKEQAPPPAAVAPANPAQPLPALPPHSSISQEYDVIHRDENGNIVQVQRIDEYGRPVPEEPIRVTEEK